MRRVQIFFRTHLAGVRYVLPDGDGRRDLLDHKGGEIKIETLEDILELLCANRMSKHKDLREHSLTLLGPRERGSTTTMALKDIEDWDRPVHRFESDCVAPGCECYQMLAPEMEGSLGAVPLEVALLGSSVVFERVGEHGLELVASHDKDLAKYCSSEDWIFFIVGKHRSGEDALFTWHPGEPLLPYGTDRTMQAKTAVKVR